jgi:hypothetical protein
MAPDYGSISGLKHRWCQCPSEPSPFQDWFHQLETKLSTHSFWGTLDIQNTCLFVIIVIPVLVPEFGRYWLFREYLLLAFLNE